MNAPAIEKKRPAIRAAQIDLFGVDGALVVSAGIVVADDSFPDVVMWGGDPFLRDPRLGPFAWRQVKPYRLDVGA